MRNKYFSDYIYSFGNTGVTLMANFGISILLAWRYGGQGVGIYTVLKLVPLLFAMVLTFGMGTASVYTLEKSNRKEEVVSTIIVITALMFVAVSALCYGFERMLIYVFYKNVPLSLVKEIGRAHV